MNQKDLPDFAFLREAPLEEMDRWMLRSEVYERLLRRVDAQSHAIGVLLARVHRLEDLLREAGGSIETLVEVP